MNFRKSETLYKIDEIILAIPDSWDNQPFIKLADDYNIKCYMGSEDDLVDLNYQVATASKADLIVRIPADNTTPESIEMDKIIKYCLTRGWPEFSSNLYPIRLSLTKITK